MTAIASFPEALPRIEAAIAEGRLRAGVWSEENGIVCMMSAIVSGAVSADDCTADGWPGWLAEINVRLFDADVGVDDESNARNDYALAVARAVQSPINMDEARERFTISCLERCTPQSHTLPPQSAWATAWASATAAEWDAAWDAAWAAAWVAWAAADAVEPAARAIVAGYAARAASRSDLIAALNASRICAVQSPINMDEARDRFTISCLKRCTPQSRTMPPKSAWAAAWASAAAAEWDAAWDDERKAQMEILLRYLSEGSNQ